MFKSYLVDCAGQRTLGQKGQSGVVLLPLHLHHGAVQGSLGLLGFHVPMEKFDITDIKSYWNLLDEVRGRVVLHVSGD